MIGGRTLVTSSKASEGAMLVYYVLKETEEPHGSAAGTATVSVRVRALTWIPCRVFWPPTLPQKGGSTKGLLRERQKPEE